MCQTNVVASSEAGGTQDGAEGSQESECVWGDVLMEEEADFQHAVVLSGPSATSQPSTSHAPPSASTSGSASPAVSSRSGRALKKSKMMENPMVALLTSIAEATSASVAVDAASAQDDCDVYGRHVAPMLRSMTPKIVEAIHAINDSLYRYTE